MAKVLIAYDSRTGDTEKIAELIAEGIRITGNEAVLKSARSMKKPEDFAGFDAVVLGSPTYHGQMMEGMKTLLFLAEKSGLEDKVGGAFGAFGWSGEAPDRIFDTMKNILKMNMVSGPLRLKSADLGGGIQMAHEYGREVSQKINL
jgi:flavorubredoxin